MKTRIFSRCVGLAIGLTLLGTAVRAEPANINPSIFVRYQFDLGEVLALLKQAQGKPLDPHSAVGRWLDEMGWRSELHAWAGKPYQLTPAFTAQLEAQDKFLRSSFELREGDAVWVPVEKGEAPYGYAQARVNPRGIIKNIIEGEHGTFVIVEVGVDNGAQGGMETKPGRYYDGRTGPVLSYGPNYVIERKPYLYSMSEILKHNAPFRATVVATDTGTKVDYVNDKNWLAKLDEFKEIVVKEKLGIDFTKPAAEVYAAQRRLMMRIFNFFKMNRNAPGGGPLLGDLAKGGGSCFTQACVMSHAVHAVGEPYGLAAVNISGSTINPAGGHGFLRIMLRGVDEVHVFDRDLTTNKVTGLEIKSNKINFISDPGWADYGKTPDFHAMMPVEEALNPKPVDANRCLYDLIQGNSYEDVVVKNGNRGAMTAEARYRDEMFAGKRMSEFLSPKGQISEAKALEGALGSELDKMVQESRHLKAKVPHERALKSQIFREIVEPRVGSLRVPGMSPNTLRILLTEYIFRSVR